MNPFIDQAIQRGLDLSNRNFNENILPSLGDQALATGGFGGSRQGVAQGIASRNVLEANNGAAITALAQQFNAEQQRQLQAEQIAGTLAGQGRQQDIAAATAAVNATPVLQASGLAGTNALLQAGQIDQNFRQSVLNDEVAKFNFTQQQPLQLLNQFANIVNRNPAQGGVPTVDNKSSGGVAGALGGAALGTSIVGALKIQNPLVAAAVLSLGALGGFFS